MVITQMEGEFWISDLKKVLQEEGVFSEDDEKKVFERSLWLPDKSKLMRWLKREDIHNPVSYCGPIIVNFMGYYDSSGKNVKVRDNSGFFSEEIPMKGGISNRIASENGVLFEKVFYGSDKPTNNLEEVRNYIRGINASREKIEKIEKRLIDELYELAKD